MTPINLQQLQELHWAIGDLIGYETDNSCGDPECCGGPFYEIEDYRRGVDLLKEWGLKYVEE